MCIRDRVKFDAVAAPHFGLIGTRRGARRNVATLPAEPESDFVGKSLAVPRFAKSMRIKDASSTSRAFDKTVQYNQKFTMSGIKRRDKKRLTRDAEEKLSWQTGSNIVGAVSYTHLTLPTTPYV
eukprot:TRINITY_DN23001_c0_g1_i2.p2 TRINITY_DN23001_c0_g1~~TRINITY_DN23001_c0_g1_i2.p2  ORF type:complete len:124 (-),score=40.21 TRINITY_DN23001_c0_g1_i2:35-406(-)